MDLKGLVVRGGVESSREVEAFDKSAYCVQHVEG